MKPALALHNLTVYYQRNLILDNLNLSIPTGSLVAIVGPNGSGKTTLIQAIMGLVQSTGLITIFDKLHTTQLHKIAYIAQRSSIDWTFPASVFDVVLMGRYAHLKIGQRPTAHDHKIARQALAQVGMLELADRAINELSGGQQQRIFLARALAQQADVLIFDEPFVGVDMKTEQIMLAIFAHLKQLGKTIIVVHHDLAVVKKHFDSVLFMNRSNAMHGSVATILNEENIAQTFAHQHAHDFNFL